MYIECTQTKNCKFSKNVSLTNILSHQVERRQSMATGLGLFTCSNVGWDQWGEEFAEVPCSTEDGSSVPPIAF